MTARYNTDKPYFHDSIILAKKGAMIYVVDEEGNRMSDGHHSVKWSGNNDFKGKTGASNYTFEVDTSEIQPWNNRFSRRIQLDDIIGSAADERIAAFAAYLKLYDEVPDGERVEMGKLNL